MKRIYILSLLFAALMGFAVYNFAGYLLRSSGTKTVPVVFAVSEIPANTRITEDMLEIRQVPS
ncbi:MAG: SAF domain-containing protein, partial [Bacillota bacterium]|nr:SAF domain-containing protein [Bacillota bacterium]